MYIVCTYPLHIDIRIFIPRPLELGPQPDLSSEAYRLNPVAIHPRRIIALFLTIALFISTVYQLTVLIGTSTAHTHTGRRALPLVV